MTTLLRRKCALAPDLLQLQRLPVLGAVTAFRAALPIRCEASGGYLSRSTSVAFAQTFGLLNLTRHQRAGVDKVNLHLALNVHRVVTRDGHVPAADDPVVRDGRAGTAGHPS